MARPSAKLLMPGLLLILLGTALAIGAWLRSQPGSTSADSQETPA